MTQPIGFGLDVSYWQVPEQQAWSTWLGKVDFVIARAGYGRTKDTSAIRHIARARDIGAKVGLYVYFRPVESAESQFQNLRAVADAVGLDGRDAVPAIDIETEDAVHPVSPPWSAPARELAERIADQYGNVMIYITAREWRMLGSPEWVPRRPMWIAHYTTKDSPDTPAGMQPTIWQFRVGPFAPDGPGGRFNKDGSPCKGAQQPWGVDHNRLLRPLPLVGSPLDPAEQSRIQGQVSMWLASEATRLSEPDRLEPPEKKIS